MKSEKRKKQGKQKKQGLEGQGGNALRANLRYGWKSPGVEDRGFAQKGGFQKGGFGGCFPVPKAGTKGYIRMSPCANKAGTRVDSGVPLYQNRNQGMQHSPRPFYETTLLFPLEKHRRVDVHSDGSDLCTAKLGLALR